MREYTFPTSPTGLINRALNCTKNVGGYWKLAFTRLNIPISGLRMYFFYNFSYKLALYCLGCFCTATIGISRLYVAAHFPHQVIGGIFAGEHILKCVCAHYAVSNPY